MMGTYEMRMRCINLQQNIEQCVKLNKWNHYAAIYAERAVKDLRSARGMFEPLVARLLIQRAYMHWTTARELQTQTVLSKR